MEEGYEQVNKSQEPLSLREEFRWHRFGLHHESPHDFMRSQWQSKPKSVIFLTYRWLMAGCFGSGTLAYMTIYFQHGHCFIYLTNWGFCLCGVTSIFGAILVTTWHCRKEAWVPPSCVVKAYWACNWSNLVMTHLIAIVYWICIYPSDRVPTSPTYVCPFANIMTHAIPPILFTVDHFVVAHPARVMHFIYPVGFCLLYTGFTIIFYYSGGHDLRGRPYIYRFLDYSKPVSAVVTISSVILLLVTCSSVLYGLYRFRTFLARKYGKLRVEK